MKILKNLKETSLSRIWQHINNPKMSFAVISAFRDKDFWLDKLNKSQLTDGEVEKLNIQNHNKFRKEIRNYGYIEQKSGYTYKDDNGEELTVEEMSFLIPRIEKEKALQLGKKYGQESILYKDENGFYLIYTDHRFGKIDMVFKNKKDVFSFKPDDVKKAYSQLIKSHHNNKVKFSYVMEKRIPSKTDAYLSMKTENIAQIKWVKII